MPQNYEGIHEDQGLIFGGTGGRYAFTHYRDSYCTQRAAEYAIQHDRYSGPPVVHYCSMSKTGKELKELDKAAVDTIYEHTSHLISDLQASGGGVVDKFRYTGCTTAAAEEAPAVDMDKLTQWVKRHEQRRKEKSLRDAVAGKSAEPRLQVKRLFDSDDDSETVVKMA